MQQSNRNEYLEKPELDKAIIHDILQGLLLGIESEGSGVEQTGIQSV